MSSPPPSTATAPESATSALYRASLGPVHTAHYLEAFARFDEAGRASPGWNPAAGLLTLNWMLFRQLWRAALVYLLVVGGLALLVLVLGRQVLQWPAPVEWGLLLVLGLLGIAIPGAYGNAWLHAETRRRMMRAVREASTLREACAALEQRASSARRLWGLGALNALLVLGAAAWVGPAQLLAALPVGVAGTTAVSPEPLAVPAEVVAAPILEPAPAVEPEAAEATPAAASAPAEPVPEPPPVIVSPPVLPPPPAVMAVAATPVAEPPAPVAPPPQETPAVKEPPAAQAPRPAPTVAPRPVPSKVAPAREPVAGPAQAHGINVGLFADPANAEKAHARLVEAGFPAILQPVEAAGGARTRVRVGPFASRAQADAAAARIRAMGLDAVVFAP